MSEGPEAEAPPLHPLDEHLSNIDANPAAFSLHYAYDAAILIRGAVKANLSGGSYYHRTNDTLADLPYLRHGLYQAAHVISKAIQRRQTVPWSVEDYVAMLSPNQDGRNPNQESHLLEHFPIPPSVSDEPEILPTVVTDENGVVLMFYLPHCISQQTMASTFLQRDIDRAIGLVSSKKPSLFSNTGKGWRTDAEYFKTGHNLEMRPGLLDLSPAWWPLGHGASNSKPGPSTALRDPQSECRWLLGEICPTLILLGAILSVIHPALFEKGMAVMEALYRDPDLTKHYGTVQSVIENWFCPFSAMSLIVNRQTPPHRDTKGIIMGFDLVVTGGNYTNGVFRTPGLGRSWRYNPGTVVGLMGKVVAHSADEVNGERWCLAMYWRERLFKITDVELPLPPIVDELIHTSVQNGWS